MREYSLTLLIAAALTYMLTPLVRELALRVNAVFLVFGSDSGKNLIIIGINSAALHLTTGLPSELIAITCWKLNI